MNWHAKGTNKVIRCTYGHTQAINWSGSWRLIENIIRVNVCGQCATKYPPIIASLRLVEAA